MELYKRYTFTTAPGAISETGIAELGRLINRQQPNTGEWLRLNPTSTRAYLPSLPYEWDYTWLVRSGDFRGKFPTRVSQYFFKKHGLKCPVSFLNELGNLARMHSAAGETYEFEFVDSFDWRDGDYGDDGSCMWYSNSGGRMMLKANGGLAMLFVGGRWQEGIARAFVVPVPNDAHILFGGYGFQGDSTLKIARIFAEFRGLPYRRIDLTNNGSSSRNLWINSGRGYVVGTADLVNKMVAYDFRWPEIYANACYSCQEILVDETTHRGADDNDYCRDCFSEMFTYCDECDETLYRDDTFEVSGGKWVCRWCLSREYQQCSDCGDYFPANDVKRIDGTYYCKECTAEWKEAQGKK